MTHPFLAPAVAKGSALILSVLLLSGCAQYDAIAESIATHAAGAADRGLKAAWWQECRVTSIGALWRLYRHDEPGWKVYAEHCLRDAPHMAEGLAKPK